MLLITKIFRNFASHVNRKLQEINWIRSYSPIQHLYY